MRNTTRAITAAVIVAIAPRLLLAADAPAAAPAPPAVPALSDLLTGWGLTTSGEFAASYYHSNGYPGSTWRGFDQDHDSFQLDEAGLQIGYQPKQGVGGFVDVIAGTDAQILSLNEGGSGNSVDVRQAYLQYATGPLTIIAGKYVTLAGAEVINPAQDTNYSRSLLFWELEPLDHTGIRATYAATDTLSFSVGVNNGWNYTDLSVSGSKTGEVNATWTPNKTFSLAATGYFGKDDVLFDGQELSLVDIVGTYNVTSALTLILNADFKQTSGNGLSGTDATTHINGFAGYANYALSDALRVSVRGEYLSYLGAGHAIEGTVTLGYTPVKNLEFRAELRYDKLSDGLTDSGLFYVRANPGATDEIDANNNTEFALQAVYKFSAP
ncbi:MAG TPA: outer membrane beta-barrel protein [Steroidobacteraceae bacterium]|nr:outer membrane beta-barrel protein [Steroidobacteraceae bacterium]